MHTTPRDVSNPYEHLRYSRGFLLSPHRCSVPVKGWVEVHFDDWWLYYDPRVELELATANGTGVALLGAAIDLRNVGADLRDVADILINELSESRDSFLRSLDWLSGRYVLVARDRNGTTLQTDATGMRSVFYSRATSLVASHAGLIAEAIGDSRLSVFADPVWDTANSVSYLPGVATVYEGIYQLTPNTELVFDPIAVRRTYPRQSLSLLDVGEVVERVYSLMISQMERLARDRRRIMISLTAGMDSRTTLAVASRVPEEIEAFTYAPRYGRFSSIPIVQIDVDVAGLIANDLSIPHSIAEIDDDNVDPALRAILKANTDHEHIWPLAQWYLENIPPDTLHIRSNLFEIGRAFYRKAARREVPLTPKLMATTHRRSQPDMKLATQAFAEYAQIADFRHFDGFDPYDLFYWEHRMGRWHANVVAESDLSHDTWVLLNARVILESLLAAPLEARIEGTVYQEIVRNALPSISGLPVNSPIRRSSAQPATLASDDPPEIKSASMNDDRISEVYKGEIWTEEAQARARRRVNWMVSQARSNGVLDLGCSQGIASILLGREGFEVVGVDVQESRIEYANADLALEAKDTQQRVRFAVGNGADLQFDDDHFDTVLLGEVIEHLAVPDRVLSEVARVLKPGGLVVVTTPFGVLRHHDHKQIFFPDDVFTLVSEHFGVTSAEVEERYFRIVGEKGADSKDAVLHQLRDSAFETVAGIQEQLADTRIESNRLASRLTNLDKLREKDSKRAADQTKRLEETRKQLEETRKRLEEARKRLESANESKKRVESAWRASKKEHQEEYRSIQSELKVATEEAKKAERLSNELGRVRRSLDRREQDVAKLRHRLAVSDWKLASLRRRRWMRLGSELSAARKRPSTIPLLPFRLFKVIRSKTEGLPRPTPPESLNDDASESKAIVPQSVEAVVPARDVPALVMVDDELRDILPYELQTYDLDREGWRSQLTSLAPSMLILDSESASRVKPDELDELLTAVRDQGVRSILWDNVPEALPGPSKSRFDALCGDGKPPSDDFDGQLVERRGWIQPRLHNPIGAYRRPEASAEVDLGNRVLAQTEYEGIAALTHAAKKYKVLRAVGDVDATHAAPVLATATPLITTSNSREVGIPVDSGEAAESLEKTLVRSRVLRARLTHPQMRAVMREQTIGRDIAELLGESENERWPQVDIMVPTKRPHMLPTILENLGRQTYPNFRLFLVAHGVEFDHAEVQEKSEQAGVELAEIVSVDDSVILGEVFNIGFGETEADVVAKVDDDDFYGAEYLWDLYSALEFSGAEVAGKWAHYVYLEGTDSTIYRFKNHEHRFTDVVAISTLLMHREVLDVERFPAEPWGSGSMFLRALGAQGGRVFAADRWNYMYIRGRDGERNTFPITDVKMLSNSDIICKGMNVDEVVV